MRCKPTYIILLDIVFHTFSASRPWQPPTGETGSRHNVLYLSICSLIHLLPNLWTQYFESEWNNSDANWHRWSLGQGHETVIFGRQQVKGQGHMRLIGDLVWGSFSTLLGPEACLVVANITLRMTEKLSDCALLCYCISKSLMTLNHCMSPVPCKVITLLSGSNKITNLGIVQYYTVSTLHQNWPRQTWFPLLSCCRLELAS